MSAATSGLKSRDMELESKIGIRGEKSRDHWGLICGLFVTGVLKRHWDFENKGKSD